MIAVHLEAGNVSLREIARPARAAGFALIRMSVAGICNTDLELQRGYYDFVGTPGHEFVGEVVEADTESLVGRRVVGEINLSCGECDLCIFGLPRHCENRTVLGIAGHPGAFAEYLTLPEKNLHIVPPQIASEQAVFIEPIAAAHRILDQVVINQGEGVAVLGDGKLGLLIAQVLHVNEARVTLFGRHKEKLRIAESVGIRTSLSSSSTLNRFRFVVESTGSADGLRQAAKMVEPSGRIIMKSTVHGKLSIDMSSLIVNEVTLMGSRCGRFEPAIDLLAAGKIEVSALISAEYPLAQAAEAFAHAARPGVLKVLLRNDVSSA